MRRRVVSRVASRVWCWSERAEVHGYMRIAVALDTFAARLGAPQPRWFS